MDGRLIPQVEVSINLKWTWVVGGSHGCTQKHTEALSVTTGLPSSEEREREKERMREREGRERVLTQWASVKPASMAS